MRTACTTRSTHLAYDTLKLHQEAVIEAMQYMTYAERQVLVALAKSYEDERANQPASTILALMGAA